MTKSEIDKTIKKIERYRKRIASSKALAIESLVRAGICDENGKLKPEYGG